MSSAPSNRLTAEEYLAIERAADRKSELIHGRMYAMSGASFAHSGIVLNLAMALSSALKGKDCSVRTNDLRVKVAETGMYTYPDVVVVCGKPELEDKNLDTLVNPTVIIEVLSDSTEAYDRGAKFAHYRHIESLKMYVLVAQKEPSVECFTREDSTWKYTTSVGLGSQIELSVLGIDVALTDVYERVDFEGETKAP